MHCSFKRPDDDNGNNQLKDVATFKFYIIVRPVRQALCYKTRQSDS